MYMYSTYVSVGLTCTYKYTCTYIIPTYVLYLHNMVGAHETDYKGSPKSVLVMEWSYRDLMALFTPLQPNSNKQDWSVLGSNCLIGVFVLMCLHYNICI